MIEVENQFSSIEQWFKRAIVLDRNWKESRREEERLKEKRGTALKLQEQRQKSKEQMQ